MKCLTQTKHVPILMEDAESLSDYNYMQLFLSPLTQCDD